MLSKSRYATLSAGLLLASQMLASCHVVSIEDDQRFREQHSASFDAKGFVEDNWQSEFIPQIEQRANAATSLLPLFTQNLDAAGQAHGRRPGDGSPWNFVVEGEGTVNSIETQAAEGHIALSIQTGAGIREVKLLTGPVIVNTAIRDSLPSIAFNDFNDQLAFAAVGSALTSRALSDASSTVAALSIGDRVEFLGAMGIARPEEPIEITPIRLRKIQNGG